MSLLGAKLARQHYLRKRPPVLSVEAASGLPSAAFTALYAVDRLVPFTRLPFLWRTIFGSPVRLAAQQSVCFVLFGIEVCHLFPRHQFNGVVAQQKYADRRYSG
jgi:hypothetical protein